MPARLDTQWQFLPAKHHAKRTYVFHPVQDVTRRSLSGEDAHEALMRALTWVASGMINEVYEIATVAAKCRVKPEQWLPTPP